MKQNGVHVASDFLLHLAGSGVRSGLVLIPCDPCALSSINDGESHHFARIMYHVPELFYVMFGCIVWDRVAGYLPESLV